MARRFLTPDTGTAAAAAAPPPSHAVQWHLHGAAMKAAVAGNILLAVLFFAAVIWRVFFTGTTGGGQQEGAAAVSPPAQEESAAGDGALLSSDRSTPAACASPRSRGLGKADLLALPVYVHGSSADDDVGKKGTATVECAVCLGELRDGETGRMLPRCGHRFHAECVDRWFRLHVTCPLCRAVVVLAGGGAVKSTKVQPEPAV